MGLELCSGVRLMSLFTSHKSGKSQPINRFSAAALRLCAPTYLHVGSRAAHNLFSTTPSLLKQRTKTLLLPTFAHKKDRLTKATHTILAETETMPSFGIHFAEREYLLKNRDPPRQTRLLAQSPPCCDVDAHTKTDRRAFAPLEGAVAWIWDVRGNRMCTQHPVMFGKLVWDSRVKIKNKTIRYHTKSLSTKSRTNLSWIDLS